ncbi:hypothetical protein IFM89_032626 [Coptis chinensis]|uniref:Cellulose synthase n=1 Tax=Coptis chinensis TaxID=261450 RepID=A0A835HQ48_9MAGN|nr:hypothetical protein IFM89_032626 [Coptis chinensis]
MMDRGRLVAGSHNRNEFIVINADDIGRAKSLRDSSGESCKICGDEVEITAEREPFVACNECGFPVCRNCYEYERREGSPRVQGDEEEEEADDIEYEFNFGNIGRNGPQQIVDATVSDRLNSSFGSHADMPSTSYSSEIPLLTYGHVDAVISPDRHALIIPSLSRSWEALTSYACFLIHICLRIEEWKKKQKHKLEDISYQGGDGGSSSHSDELDDPDLPKMDEGRQPLSRKIPIPSSKINPYRLIILLRIVILGFFFHYRLLHPVQDAYGLWLTSVICEIWFAVSWILDQFPKWSPIERETYLDRLSLRYEKEGNPSELAEIDIFVIDKVVCYVSDDGAAMLTFEALSETSEFARKWVPFCKKFNIEPRAPEWYFSQKIDYLKKTKSIQTFERTTCNEVQIKCLIASFRFQREYEGFKVRINSLVDMAKKVPEEGWTMQDGTPWPGNNVRDHPGMIQVFLGQDSVCDVEGNELPRLVYVSREKRPGFDHHKKAGAMNALVRVSAIISNAPYFLNVDCDHYVNNSKALREAMCFMMDPISGKKICYVQFPQRFDGIDRNDRYSNRNIVFFDINMKGLDGIQGPIYVGTGCVFRRQALYGFDSPTKKKPPAKTCNCWPKWCCCLCCRSRKKNRKMTPKKEKRKKPKSRGASKQIHALENIDEGNEAEIDGERSLLMPEIKYEKKYGQSPVFIASTLLEDGGIPQDVNSASLLKEAIHVISCGYEDKTAWGKEIGWIYGSVTEDILTGFKMHCHGWRSVYCIPKRPAFIGSAPINLSDRLHQVLRWALGSVEIFLSKHCPIWKRTIYPWETSAKLKKFAVLRLSATDFHWDFLSHINALCMQISNHASIVFIALFVSIALTGILEMRWGRVQMDDWWRNEQFWVIGGVSSHFYALCQGLLKVLLGVNTNFTVTSKVADDGEFSDLYLIKWTWLLVPPMTLLIFNIIGLVAGIANAINTGYESWGPLFGRLFFAFWVIVHLNPFLRGLMGKQDRVPSIVLVWSILLASIASLMWARINPFLAKSDIILEECGLDCD